MAQSLGDSIATASSDAAAAAAAGEASNPG